MKRYVSLLLYTTLRREAKRVQLQHTSVNACVNGNLRRACIHTLHPRRAAYPSEAEGTTSQSILNLTSRMWLCSPCTAVRCALRRPLHRIGLSWHINAAPGRQPIHNCMTPRPLTSPPSTSTLRPYQVACIEASLQAIRNGVTRQSVSLPVGSGKTVIFASMIPRLPQPRPGATRVLVLAHRTELLQQAAATIRRICPELTVGIEQGSQTAGDADVVLGSVPTLGRKGSLRLSSLDPSEFKAIIVDEAHHVTAATYLRVFDYFGCRESGGPVHLWGCSATLRRHDGVSLGAVFDQVSYHRTILEMWDEGWLCKAQPRRIHTGVDLSAVPVSSVTKDFSQPKLAQAINDARRNDIIVAAWKELAQSRGRRSTLVFCVDVDHIQRLQAAFKAQGVDAYGVDGQTAVEERAAILDGFRDGEIPVLLNCAVYTEGTDIPTTDCIIMARPTKSSVLYQQMLGRGLRLYPGKTDCLVLDMVDNCGRNTVLTVPSLLGLDPNFDTCGDHIDEVFVKMKELTAHCPEAVLARSLADAEDKVTRHRRLTQNAAPIDVASHLRVSELKTRRDLTQWRKLTSLPFTKSPAGDFFLEIRGVGTIRVHLHAEADGDVHYRSELLAGSEDQGFPIPLVADTLEAAFAGVQSYLQRDFPRAYHSLFDLAVRNPHGPATEKQVALLRKLIGAERASRVATKGQASYLISQITNKSKSDRTSRRLTKLKEDRTAKIKRGLVVKF